MTWRIFSYNVVEACCCALKGCDKNITSENPQGILGDFLFLRNAANSSFNYSTLVLQFSVQICKVFLFVCVFGCVLIVFIYFIHCFCLLLVQICMNSSFDCPEILHKAFKAEVKPLWITSVHGILRTALTRCDQFAIKVMSKWLLLSQLVHTVTRIMIKVITIQIGSYDMWKVTGNSEWTNNQNVTFIDYDGEYQMHHWSVSVRKSFVTQHH